MGSDKVAEEEGEDLDDEEYDEEEEEDDEDRPRKKPKHGGFILDEAGTIHLLPHGFCPRPYCVNVEAGFVNAFLFFAKCVFFHVSFLWLDVDDEYEDEEEQWEEGAEDILEKGEKAVLGLDGKNS